MSNDTIECLFVEAFIVKKVLIGIIYRPPDTPISMFNEHLKTVIDSIKCSNIPCYLLGDFNINLLNQSSHQATSDFLDILYFGGFIPLISRPTRITENSATLIDHIYTNSYHVNTAMYQGVLVTDITDHYPVFHISHFHDNQANYI